MRRTKKKKFAGFFFPSRPSPSSGTDGCPPAGGRHGLRLRHGSDYRMCTAFDNRFESPKVDSLENAPLSATSTVVIVKTASLPNGINKTRTKRQRQLRMITRSSDQKSTVNTIGVNSFFFQGNQLDSPTRRCQLTARLRAPLVADERFGFLQRAPADRWPASPHPARSPSSRSGRDTVCVFV